MSGDSTKEISSPFRGGILDRVQSHTSNTILSETQSEVDQLVGNAIATASDEKTMASLFGAGMAARFIRLGTVAASAQSLAPSAVQGISHATALAGESAVFASMERGFARLEGHAVTQSFQKDWARAAINLGSIKLLGGAAQGQNLMVQHLLIDSGMVVGHHAGYAFGVTDKPQGGLAQQMIQAEGMNLGMKGSLALLHGFSPGLSAMEKSFDLTLKSQEAGLFSQNQPLPFFSQLATVTEGAPEAFSTDPWKTEAPEGPLRVFSKGDQGSGSGKSGGGSRPSWRQRFREAVNEWRAPGRMIVVPPRGAKKTPAAALEKALGNPEPAVRLHAVLDVVLSKDPTLLPGLDRALGDTDPGVRVAAIWALAERGLPKAHQILENEIDPSRQRDPLQRKSWVKILGEVGLGSESPELMKTLERALNDSDVGVKEEAAIALAKIGAKSLELAETLHRRAMKYVKEAEAPSLSDLKKSQYYSRAMEMEWNAAFAVPVGNEPLRGDRYVNLVWFASKCGRTGDAEGIILEALAKGFGAEDKLRRLVEKFKPWNKDRLFILSALKQARAHLEWKQAFPRAMAGSGDNPTPNIYIMMMSSKESEGSGSSGKGPSGSSEIGKETSSQDPAEIIRELTELAESGNKAATEALVRIATAKPGETGALAAVARAEIVKKAEPR